MKRLILGASLLALCGFAASAGAHETTGGDVRINPTMVSGDADITSDYRNRGISRSDEGPALQGRIQLNNPIGLYGGLSGSTVDLNLEDDANVEGVLFGGFKGNYDTIDYNAKLSYTGYVGGDSDVNYWELSLTGGYDFGPFYGSLTWAFSPDYINSSGSSFYYAGDITAPLVYDLTAKAHMGFSIIGDNGDYADDYTDWSLGLWYNYKPYDLDIGLEYVDSTLDDNDCVESCGSQGVVTLKKPFGW